MVVVNEGEKHRWHMKKIDFIEEYDNLLDFYAKRGKMICTSGGIKIKKNYGKNKKVYKAIVHNQELSNGFELHHAIPKCLIRKSSSVVTNNFCVAVTRKEHDHLHNYLAFGLLQKNVEKFMKFAASSPRCMDDDVDEISKHLRFFKTENGKTTYMTLHEVCNAAKNCLHSNNSWSDDPKIFLKRAFTSTCQGKSYGGWNIKVI